MRSALSYDIKRVSPKRDETHNFRGTTLIFAKKQTLAPCNRALRRITEANRCGLPLSLQPHRSEVNFSSFSARARFQPGLALSGREND